MLSISSLVEFLLDLLRDDHVQADFAADPQATLAAHGLAGVTAQDVRDVRPLLADHHGVRASGDGGHRSHDGGTHAAAYHPASHQSAPLHEVDHHGSWHAPVHCDDHDDAVREIRDVTHHYQAEPTVVQQTTNQYNQYNTFELSSVDNSVHAAEGATVVKDSFNQDNDGVDNKGGTIDHSVVGGGNVSDAGNTTAVTQVQDSFNDDHSATATDSFNHTATSTTTDSLNDNSTAVHDSLNTDNSTAVHDSLNTDNSTAVHDSFGGDTVNGTYDVHAPALSTVAVGEPVGAEHALA